MLRVYEGEVVRETEKAILVSCKALGRSNWTTIEVWMPKSQSLVRDDGVYAREWLFAAKTRETGLGLMADSQWPKDHSHYMEAIQ